MCQQQYFLDYVLGWAGPSGKKADKGTIVHKVLETLAIWKKENQHNEKEIKCNLSNGLLDYLVERVYEYYTRNLTHHTWEKSDLTDCRRWVKKALEFNDGMFDPRKRTIVDAEPHFDFEIRRDWAKIRVENASTYLSMKGTIDLITDLGDGVFEMIDWKTGQRKDWATGKRKEQDTLYNDAQLRIYHMAAKHLYPDVKSFLITINYINDGGPFTIHLSDSDLEETENLIRKRFEQVKNTSVPKLNRSWMCERTCHHGMSTFEKTNIEPIREFRTGQITPYGRFMTKCEQTKYMIHKIGIEEVINRMTKDGFSLSNYSAPGEV